MKKYLISLVLCLISPLLQAQAANSEEASKRVVAKELLQALNAESLVTQVVQGAIAQMSPTLDAALKKDSRISETQRMLFIEKFIQNFVTEFSSPANRDKYLRGIEDVYIKYLSIEEMRYSKEFYSTPVGKRLLEITPQLTLDSMKIGSGLGQEIAIRTAQKTAIETGIKLN